MGPINYMAAMPQIDLNKSIQSGLMTAQAFAELAKISAAAEQQRQAQAAQQAYAQDISAFLSAPSVQGARGLLAKYPQQHQAYGELIKGLTADQEKAEVKDAADLASMISTGNVDMARAKVAERRVAMQNSGQPTGALDILDQQLQTNPAQAHGTALLTLAALPGGQTVLDNMLKAGQMPSKLQQAAGEARKVGAEADAAEVTAKYAEPTAAAELAGKQEGVKLTRQQIAQAKATTSKFDAETQKLLQESQNGNPEKRFDAEAKLRSEYEAGTKNYRDVTEAYRRVKSAGNDGAGDIALLYSYMKMLDPGSVVREGEFATASNSAGIPTAVQNIYNRALSGQRLTDGQRKTFTGQAEKLANAAAVREQEVRSGLSAVAKNYGLNAANIFGAGVTSAQDWTGDKGDGKPKQDKTQSGVPVREW